MKYYLIAGEASGDLHASGLMHEIKKRDPKADFRFWGGDRMAKVGGHRVMHYKDTAFMGFVDVFLNLHKIRKFLKLCKKDISDYKPDALILVDYPGFNLRIAEFAKNAGFKTIYYISPKVWAWKQSRAKKIKRFVDKMFVIFPFETDFYKKYNYSVEYVGNPVVDAVDAYAESMPDSDSFKQKNDLPDKPLIALLPGSRKQEIKFNFPMMSQLAEQFPDYAFVVAQADSLETDFLKKYSKSEKIAYLSGQTYAIMKHAEAAVVTSGTATLETALFNTPQVVCYRGDALSFEIARRLVKVDYISLVNLTAEKEVIKEMIQYDMKPKTLKDELNRLINTDSYRNKILEDYKIVRELLGGSGASERTAEKIVELLSG